MIGLVDAVAQYLAAVVDGLAYSETTNEGNVYVDHLPSSPDRAVATFSMSGPEPDSKLPYDPAEFQVLVRGMADDYVWCRDTWSRIYSALHGKRNLTLPGGLYVVFILSTQASAVSLGTDENGRPIFMGHYRAEVYNPTDERPE